MVVDYLDIISKKNNYFEILYTFGKDSGILCVCGYC